MQKGGDLHESRGNRKTVGAKPWYKISADSVRRRRFRHCIDSQHVHTSTHSHTQPPTHCCMQAVSILRSLEMDLRGIVADPEATTSVDKVRTHSHRQAGGQACRQAGKQADSKFPFSVLSPHTHTTR